MTQGNVHHKLLRHAGLLSGMTLASRVLGMVRDVICAAIFGTGAVWDAFIYAFTFPNFLRRVLGEGALAGVFIPTYAEVKKKEGLEAADRLAHNMFSLLVVGVGILVVFVLAALFAIRRSGVLGETGMLTTQLLLILFPYILFLSLYAWATALLNTRDHFLVPSLGPIVLNVVWIGAVLYVAPRWATTPAGQVTVLAVCLLGAGFLQFALQLIPLRRSGFHVRWHLSVKNAAVRKVFKLFVPATLGFAVMQVNVLVDRTLAFFVGEGANSSLWYGNRLVQLPLGIFAIAMGTALLPKLSAQSTAEDYEGFGSTLSFSLKTVFVLVIPAAAGLVALRTPIIQMLFERGAFDAVSTARTARTLAAYALGLFAFSGIKLVVTAFYALKDTRTPVVIASFAVVLNIVLNLLLMRPLGEAGLALATAISGIVNFALLISVLDRSRSRVDLKGIGITFAKSVLASILMALVVTRLFGWLGGADGSVAEGLFRLALTIGAGMLFYVGMCALLRMPEVGKAWALVRRRRHDA